MRDTIKNLDYFENRLRFLNTSIDEFEQLIAENINSEKVNLRSGYLTLLGYYTSKINCIYSMGMPIESIKSIYPKYLDVFSKTWNKETGSYIQLVVTVSLGILIDMTKEQINQISDLLKKESFQDYFIDYLLHQIDNNWEIRTDKFAFPIPYELLNTVINANDNKDAIYNLSIYLDKEWYNGHSDAGWYNSHKSSHDIYTGYWSYESAALAKLLQLDDRELKNSPYYPYDLVHYNN